jgi:chromate reductase
MRGSISTMTKVLVFAGSARDGSFNRMLARASAEAARGVGAEVTEIDLAGDLALPLYDGDLEAAEGPPPAAMRLKELFTTHDALWIACPEYNGSITPLLKNTIDWVSRPVEGEKPLGAYRGLVAALVAASPGRLGGLRGLTHVREILTNIGVLVLPEQLTVGGAGDAFDEDGRLVDERAKSRLQEIAKRLLDVVV